MDLVTLGPAYLAAWLAGEPCPDLGFVDPFGFLRGAEDVVRLRLDDVRANPTAEPWLLRAMVLRGDRTAVGFIGGHAAPDARGMVELGYEVHPAFHQRGYATEAVSAWIAWAARSGARTIRASVSPHNAASLLVLRRQGFVQVGEQIDPEDGHELVFEKRAEDPALF